MDIMNWRLNKSIRFYKISNTCEEGGAHLRVSFWHLLTNLKNNYLLKTMLKWANKCKHFHICNVAFKKKKEKHLEIPSKNPTNQNFKKMKTLIEDIIILHMCTKNCNHMMHGS